MEDIHKLVTELQKFDNPKGYKLTHKKVQEELQPIMDKIIAFGEAGVDQLHLLLEKEESWSCWLALRLLGDIKSKKSVLPLVEFIRRTDESDYWESGEEAMKALTAMGKPVINVLISELKKDFQEQKQYTYLLGALTEIKDEAVFQFMTQLMQDYIQNYKKYDEWFSLIPFVLDFDKQESKEALPLLEKLSGMGHLSKEERLEIDDTIKVLKNPEQYEKEMVETMELMKNKFPELMRNTEKLLNPKKLDIDAEEYWERANEADEDFEASFKCNSCGERQNLKTGLIWSIGEDTFAFEHEIMCKHCFSHEISLSDSGLRELNKKQMRIFLGKEGGIIPVGKEIMIENKKMHFEKAQGYILKRIKEEPENGELYLRAANHASKRNNYSEAIEFYIKSMELDGTLIANYVNLVEIYAYRAKYYGREEYRQKAEELFMTMVELFNSHQYNAVTIANKEDLPQIVYVLGERLGFEMKRGKIGRNEPCPCGSGIKYKKCCMEEKG